MRDDLSNRNGAWSSLVAVSAVAAVATLAAGCASSSKQTKPRSETSSSKQADTEKEAESESSESTKESAKRRREPKPEPVELASIIGADTSGGLPEGCPKKWQELKEREYDGTVYACSGFRVPEIYREPTIQIGVRENKVRRITLQAFYEAGDEIRAKFDEVTDLYQQRCDVQGAGGDALSFRCDGYVAEVSHRERAGSLRIVIGLKNWDLPQ